MSLFRPETFRATDFRALEPGTANFRPYIGDVPVSVAEGLGLAESITFETVTSVQESVSLAESVTFNADWVAGVDESVTLSESVIFTVITDTVVNDCSTPYWPIQGDVGIT